MAGYRNVSKPFKPILRCPAFEIHGCPGTILAHVAADHLTKGKPACCRECAKLGVVRKYRVPPGTDRKPPRANTYTSNNSTPTHKTQREKALEAELNKLKQANAKLTEQAPHNEGNETEEKLDLKELQAFLEQAKKLKWPTEDIEAKIQLAKEQQASLNGDLDAITRRLKIKENQHKQLVQQVQTEEEKLKKLKEKALESMEELLKLRKEEEKAIQAKGYVTGPAAAEQHLHLPPLPNIPEGATEVHKQQWAQAMEESNQQMQQEAS